MTYSERGGIKLLEMGSLSTVLFAERGLPFSQFESFLDVLLNLPSPHPRPLPPPPSS